MYHKIGNVEKIIDVFRTLGFNDEQILKLVAKKKSYISRFNKINESFAFYYAEMKKRNYTEEEIYALATNYPNAMFYRFYRGIMKKEYVDFIEEYRASKDEKTKSNLDLEGVTKVLKSIGISQKKLDDVYTFSCSVLWMDIKDLKDNITFHKSCGITHEQLRINVNKYPRTLELGEKDCQDLLKEMKKFNLGKNDLGRLISTCAKLKIKLNPERFTENLKWAEDMNLDLIKLGKNILKSNIFVINKRSTLEKYFYDIVKLGLSEDEVRKIVSSTPSTLTMDKGGIAYTMNLLILFGLSEEEMIKVITEYSGIFTLSFDNIIAKLRVLRDYNLMWYIVKKPKNLIQSAELIEARAAHLKAKYDFDDEEFARYVFQAEENFVRMFKFDNDHVKNIKILQKK